MRASTAPPIPTPPQAAICHGVHGPWPMKMFETSGVIAPTANPGAPPSAYPDSSTMSVVGFTFGNGANASRPTTASAASAATSASTRADGRERSYHANATARPNPRIANEASCQVT